MEKFEFENFQKIKIFENFDFPKNRDFRKFRFLKKIKLNFLCDHLIFSQKFGCVGKPQWRTIDIWWENIIPNRLATARASQWPPIRPYQNLASPYENLASRRQNLAILLPKTVFCIHQKNEKLYRHVFFKRKDINKCVIFLYTALCGDFGTSNQLNIFGSSFFSPPRTKIDVARRILNRFS